MRFTRCYSSSVEQKSSMPTRYACGGHTSDHRRKCSHTSRSTVPFTRGSGREVRPSPNLCRRHRTRRTEHIGQVTRQAGAGIRLQRQRSGDSGMKSVRDTIEHSARVAEILKSHGVDERFRTFSPESAAPETRIWAPSQAMTKFPMEQTLGDWAEEAIRIAINRSHEYKAVPFGDNDKTLSEAEDFAERYREGKRREMAFGKRSDLLLFHSDISTVDDASTLSGEEAEKICKECLAGLEVRSSRTSADKFIDYRLQQRESGKRPTKMEPSFTVKVEDLNKVFRWISRNEKPIVYIQVFFDSVYALNFSSVFDFIINRNSKLKLENPGRSGKYTIMIPLSIGTRIGEVEHPEFQIIHNKYADGRHEIYGSPHGGGALIRIDDLLPLL